MHEPLYWDDAYPIALRIRRFFPQIELSGASPQELRTLVLQLEGFADDPTMGHLERLEDIQREWLDIT